MKVKGVLLKFDVPNGDGLHDAISKDCKIDIPDKVPIVDECAMEYPPIGFANVTRTNEGLIFKGEVVSPYSDAIAGMIKDNKTVGAGGYYTEVKRDVHGFIFEMTLRAVCCVGMPVNPDYKFEIVKDESQYSDES